MTEQVLTIEKQGAVAWLKLNRPKVMNCLNRELLQELLKACDSLRGDRSIRVVAIIGSGVKSFCAGADLAERKGMTQGDTLDYLALINRTMRAIETLPQVVIAAINGSAWGGGFELALACDLRVMVASAKLQLTEVKLGIIPGAGGTQRLPRLIGKSKAKELILTAAPVTAELGTNLGLIHRTVVIDETYLTSAEGQAAASGYLEPLINYVSAWATEIASAAPLSLRQAKIAIDQGYDRDLEAGLALETRAYLELVNTRDRLEGLAAFAEKRPPVYVGE
jgi:methylglutaconyl-CoA hydratase